MPSLSRWIFSLALTAGLLAALLSGCASKTAQVEDKPFQPKYRTIGHQMLAMEKDLGAKESDLRRLDAVIGRAVAVIDRKVSYGPKEAASVLETIHIIVKESYTYRPQRLLHQGLKANQLDCDLFVALYQSIAEVVKLPIQAVVAPLHTFVRWRLDGGGHLNWETTNGSETADQYYLSGSYLEGNQHFYRPNFDLTPGIESGAYLRGLTNLEFLAIPHINLAARYLELYQALPADRPRPRLNLEKALKHLQTAVSLDAKRPEAHHGLGIILNLLDRRREALASLDRAVSLFSQDPGYHFDRGMIWLAEGNLERSAEDLSQAYRLNPGHKQAAFALAALYRRKGDLAESENWWKKAVAPPPVSEGAK